MESDAFTKLHDFITAKMRMSHIYQPVMLLLLLERGGTALVEDIAKTFLQHDQSQIAPYGCGDQGAVWLHPKCWAAWTDDRLQRAAKALSKMGLSYIRILVMV